MFRFDSFVDIVERPKLATADLLGKPIGLIPVNLPITDDTSDGDGYKYFTKRQWKPKK